MNRTFSHILLIGLLGSTANMALAQNTSESTPADIVISSGLEDGGYWNAASRLQSVGSSIGLTVENQRSTGSISNLKELANANSTVNLTFAQADALQFYLKENPEFEQTVEILENIGEECVFIISHKDSKIRTDKDMQEKRQLNLGIRSPNSGIRVTFDYMATLVPELQNLSVSYGNTVDMMENFITPQTDVEAVMVVQGPNELSPELVRILASPDQFRFVKIRDKRFTEMSFRGRPIYHPRKVKPGAIDDARAVETICVRGLLLANRDKLSLEQRAKLETVITTRWSEVHLQPK